MVHRPALLALLCVLAGCGASDDPGAPSAAATPGPAGSATTPAPTATPTPRPPVRPALCRARAAVEMGTLVDPALDEISGLVFRGNRYWAVEDSGGPPAMVALSGDGVPFGVMTLDGATNVDWEDLAAGPGPDGVPSLYAADIGDNDGVRADGVQVYRVPAPSTSAPVPPSAPAARLELRYPDGAQDAETLLMDPVRDELVVVTKRVLGARALRGGPQSALAAPGSVVELGDGRDVDLGVVTAGDVSPDGRLVALRSYGTLAVWRRRGEEPLTRTLSRPATCRAPASLSDEGQGEALALIDDGRAAVTLPEGAGATFRLYEPPR